jgi:hypothetical protein
MRASASWSNFDRETGFFGSSIDVSALRCLPGALRAVFQLQMLSHRAPLDLHEPDNFSTFVFSPLLEHQERIGDMQAADATKKVSPIAWQHINLHGRYEFLKQLDPINVGAIIRELTKIPMNHEAPLAA